MKRVVLLILVSFAFLNAKSVELKFIEGGVEFLNFNYEELNGEKIINSETSGFNKIAGINFKTEFKIKQSFTLGASFEYSLGKAVYDGQTNSGKKLNYEHSGLYLFQPEIYIKKDLMIDFYTITPRFGIGYRYWERGKGNFEGDYDETYKWSYWFMGVEANSDITKKLNVGIILNYQRAFSAEMVDYAGEINSFDLQRVDGISIVVPARYTISPKYAIIAEYKYDFWDIEGSSGVYDNILQKTYYEPPSETKNQYISLKLRMYF